MYYTRHWILCGLPIFYAYYSIILFSLSCQFNCLSIKNPLFFFPSAELPSVLHPPHFQESHQFNSSSSFSVRTYSLPWESTNQSTKHFIYLILYVISLKYSVIRAINIIALFVIMLVYCFPTRITPTTTKNMNSSFDLCRSDFNFQQFSDDMNWIVLSLNSCILTSYQAEVEEWYLHWLEYQTTTHTP